MKHFKANLLKKFKNEQGKKFSTLFSLKSAIP